MNARYSYSPRESSEDTLSLDALRERLTPMSERARSADHAECENCHKRINGYVSVTADEYLCADCLAIGMGIVAEEYLTRVSADSIDYSLERN